MKVKPCIAALALALTGGVFARDLGALTNAPASFAATTAGVFTSNHTFVLAALSNVSGAASAFPNAFIGVTVSSGSFDWTDNNAADGFSFAGLGAGSYIVSMFGNAAAPGVAFGYVQAAPVPEPETYAMLMTGLVALGFLANRRRV